MKYLAPTPWAVVEDGVMKPWSDGLSITDEQGGTIAYTTRGYESNGYGGCPSWTNARLMAASPDLLAALQRTLSWLTGYQGSAAMGKDGPYEQARAAIAKATGTPS